MHAGSAIDGILEREDCTLTELLDQDDVLQECKANNRKLIDFLVDQKVMEEMVGLVVNEPDEDADEKSRFKHPNTACNLLTSDIIQIVDKLSGETSLLDQLWSFLETKKQLNALQASFFSKVMSMLLKSKTEMMLDYIRGKSNAIQLFLDHIDTSAIMDLVLVLSSCCDIPQQKPELPQQRPELKAELMNWLEQERLIPRLVSLIDPFVNEAKQSNASQTLCEMLRASRENILIQAHETKSNYQPDQLIQMLEDPALVSQLLSNMLKSTDTDSCLTHSVSFILALFEPRAQVSKNSPLGFTIFIPETPTPAAINVSALVEAVIPYLPQLHELLENPGSSSPVELTIGVLDPPFGNARLQIVRLITALLVTNIQDVYTKLAELNTLQVLIDLFFHYDLNNFLHFQVQQVVKTILSSPVALAGSDSEDNISIFQSLFQGCRLLQRIVQASEEDATVQSQKRVRRKGFMGHLTQIVGDVLKEAEAQPRIKAAIEELAEEDLQRWTDFVTGPFAEVRRKNEMDLGGKPPVVSSFDESGEEEDFGGPAFVRQDQVPESDLQQEYTHYQMQQMSHEFMDAFGFDDDDFPASNDSATTKFNRIQYFDFAVPAEEDNPGAALFEACCQERIQPYGELEEEDLWEEKELVFAETATQEEIGIEMNRVDNLVHGESTSSEDEIFYHGSKTEGKGDGNQQFAVHFTVTDNSKEVVEDMEINLESGDWESGNLNAEDKQFVMDMNIPDWAKEPVAAQQEAGWANFDNLSDVPFDDDDTITMSIETNKSPSSLKYTPEIAEELMNRADQTDGQNEEVGTDDDSDDSDERSGSYNFLTADELEASGKTEARNQLLMTTNAQSMQDESESSQTDLVDAGVNVDSLEVNIIVNTPDDGCIVSHSTDTKEEMNGQVPVSSSTGEATECTESTDEGDLRQNYGYLSSSGMMKVDQEISPNENTEATQGKTVGDLDLQGDNENRAQDIEHVRNEARQAMELYDREISNTNDSD